MGDDNKQNNFQNFIKLQKEIVESIPKEGNVNQGNIPSTLTLDELFKFLEQNFNEFREVENLNAVIPFMHRCLKMWAKRDFLSDDISLVLYYFLEQHKDAESDLHIVVQIIFQVLNSCKSFENKEITIGTKVFVQLNTILPTIQKRNLLSNAIACIQLYLNMFPTNLEIMLTLWSNLSQRLQMNTSSAIIKDTDIDILIQLFDEFQKINANIHDDATVIATIQHLLKSDQRKYRKCGYYLFKKMLQCIVLKLSNISSIWLSPDQCQQIERSWRLYITIMENIEENQSHLILPSLNNLQELITCKQLSSSWLDILYMRILTHNNNLVLRWAMEFFLQTFTCSDLTTDTIKYLLEASNSNLLYNHESYFINLEYFSIFLKGDLTKIYTIIGDINWKPIPLYIWLNELNEKELPTSISYELILKISSRVRALQNSVIRENTIYKCNELFKNIIEQMSMEEYVTYVEALYNSTDIYHEHAIIYSKKSFLMETKTQFVFKQRFMEIFANSSIFNCNFDSDIKEFIDFLNDIPVHQHGLFRFVPFKFLHLFNDYCVQMFKQLYNLDLNSLESCTLPEIIKEFEKCLLGGTFDKQELMYCRLAAISFYINKLCTLDNDNDETLRLIFNSELSANQLLKLSSLLQSTKNKLNFWIIDELVNKVFDKNMAFDIIEYIKRTYDTDITDKYIQIIWEKYPQYLPCLSVQVLQMPNQTRSFNGIVNKGESRIEQLFSFHQFNEYRSDLWLVKRHWIIAIRSFSDAKYILYLLKCHKEITEKKPRYFENSNEHRIKLRIAIGIHEGLLHRNVISNDIFDEIWDILINENNQLNITYIYEFILGKYDERNDVIIEKLKEAHSLTSSQQVSIISVAYNFCLARELNNTTKETITLNLLALTMGANFQTRLFAQMTLLKLLQNDKFKNMPNKEKIIQSIQNATGLKLQEYLNDIRIHMCDIESRNIISVLLFVTNAPFDEILNPDFEISKSTSSETDNQTIKCREWYLKKLKSEDTAISISEINDQLQRKMNPVNDVTERNQLIIYPIEENIAEMFVIASLIDKLPNLGGIARTCEVLGINNLVMDSKKHTEKNDFKNLSMTAENSLNIIEVKPSDLKEFLINKQLQGFKIVGAEQTSNSKNFNNFEFPKKCILLLGHEKNGIPAPLLGLLDYAVEIPQFGQVRSLNVHVTGALFMWEYCKQHLMQKLT